MLKNFYSYSWKIFPGPIDFMGLTIVVRPIRAAHTGEAMPNVASNKQQQPRLGCRAYKRPFHLVPLSFLYNNYTCLAETWSPSHSLNIPCRRRRRRRAPLLPVLEYLAGVSGQPGLNLRCLHRIKTSMEVSRRKTQCWQASNCSDKFYYLAAKRSKRELLIRMYRESKDE